MLLTRAFKDLPGNVARELVTSDSDISLGRSRTNIFSTIPEARSEIKLSTLSAMNLQPKKEPTIPRELRLSSDDDIDYCLPYFEGQMFASIVEDAIIELRILGECSTDLQLIKTLSKVDSLIRLRFNVTEPSVPTDEIFDIDPGKPDSIENKMRKVHKDRDTIDDLLSSLYVELSTKRCYDELEDHVSNILEKKENFKILQETEAKHKILCKELRKQLRSQRNRIKTVKYDGDVSIEKLSREIEDENLMTEIRDRHVRNWEKARTEQHVLTIKKKEGKLIKSSNYYKVSAYSEDRVHAEIETLTYIIISDTLRQIEELMEKYDTDMEMMDLEIHIRRNKYTAMKEKRLELEQIIALHNKQLWDWNKFKEEREKMQLYHDTMQKSAVILQAWWRGIIVRKQLGPFRPKKKTRPKK